MDDELYLAFGAKVTTTSNYNPTSAPSIAWRGLRYLSAKTVPWPPVRVHNVRFRSKADMCSAKRHVRFTPKSRHVRRTGRCQLSANSGHSSVVDRGCASGPIRPHSAARSWRRKVQAGCKAVGTG